MSTGSSQRRTGMDILTLPCAQPWGVPPPGVLFTPAAYRRYSVAFQQAELSVPRELHSPLLSPPIAGGSADSDGGGSMEALSGYASPGQQMPDATDDDWEPGDAADDLPAAAAGERIPVGIGGPTRAAMSPTAGSSKRMTVAQGIPQGAAAPHVGTSVPMALVDSDAGGKKAKTSRTQQHRQPASGSVQPASRKRKAFSQGGATGNEVEIITSDEPVAGNKSAAANAPNMGPGDSGLLHQKTAAAANREQGSQQPSGRASKGGAAQDSGTTAAHRQQHKKRKHQEQHWSSLSAEDHAWFLARQGRELEGQEALVFQALAEHVAAERAAVLAAQRDAAAAFSDKYRFAARRSLQQMEADNVQRRARVRNYPRLYRVHAAPIPIPAAGTDAEGVQGQERGAGEGADAPDMWHLQQLQRSAPDMELALPRCPFRVPLDVPYLPSEVEIGPQVQPKQATVATAAGMHHPDAEAGSGPRVKASIASVRKSPAPEVSQDPRLAALLATAADTGDAVDVAMAAATFETLVATLPHDLSLGWEIPVRIGPTEVDDVRVSSASAEHGMQRKQGGGGNEVNPSRCIFLDKPLLRRGLTMRERHERLYKHALLSIALRSARNAESAAFGAPLRVGSDAARAATASASFTEAAAEQPDQQAEAPHAQAGTAASAGAGGASPSPEPAMPRRVTRAAARAADSVGGGADARHTAGDSPHPAPHEAQRPGRAGAAEGAARAGDGGKGAAAGEQQPDSSTQAALPAPSLIATTRRGRAYDLWQLGRYRVVVRAHEAAVLRDPARPALLARAKMEYMPKFSLEAVTAQEVARRWAALQLRPEAALLVGRFAVETSELLRVELLRLADVLAQGEETGFRPAHAYRLIAALLQTLSSAPPGRYLLTHMPGSDIVTCFQALPPELDTLQVRAQPLPCAGAQPGAVYDLHAAHAESGATDEAAFPFVPPQWRPFNEHVPQIPGTFPVRVRGAPKPGVPRADEATKERRRMRKLLPSAWAHLGIGNDWDTTATGWDGGSGTGGGGKAAYARALEEGAEEL